MFGIGIQEILVVLVIALVVIGPKKLPELAKSLGKGYGEFRRAFEDMKNTINVDINSDDEKERLRKINANVAESENIEANPVPDILPYDSPPAGTPAGSGSESHTAPSDGTAAADREHTPPAESSDEETAVDGS
jgi:Tat protein translocase TatB subunit